MKPEQIHHKSKCTGSFGIMVDEPAGVEWGWNNQALKNINSILSFWLTIFWTIMELMELLQARKNGNFKGATWTIYKSVIPIATAGAKGVKGSS